MTDPGMTAEQARLKDLERMLAGLHFEDATSDNDMVSTDEWADEHLADPS
jgi:hypothetical protein